MLISLVGLPGSGKSTVGRRVASELGLAFFDADTELEREAGCTIASVFREHGEPWFRDLEQGVLARLTNENDGVIATGGGAVLRDANRTALRSRSTVVYLESSIPTLLRRLGRLDRRPLLAGEEDVASKLRGLSAERDSLYRQTAHLVVTMDRLSTADAVGLVIAKLQLTEGTKGLPSRGQSMSSQ